nr:ATP synthase F0 subunit 8 [Anaspides jarmani]
MPQMAPLFWFWLFLFFSFIFIIFMSLAYFLFPLQKNNFYALPSPKPFFLWKW